MMVQSLVWRKKKRVLSFLQKAEEDSDSVGTWGRAFQSLRAELEKALSLTGFWYDSRPHLDYEGETEKILMIEEIFLKYSFCVLQGFAFHSLLSMHVNEFSAKMCINCTFTKSVLMMKDFSLSWYIVLYNVTVKTTHFIFWFCFSFTLLLCNHRIQIYIFIYLES